MYKASDFHVFMPYAFPVCVIQCPDKGNLRKGLFWLTVPRLQYIMIGMSWPQGWRQLTTLTLHSG